MINIYKININQKIYFLHPGTKFADPKNINSSNYFIFFIIYYYFHLLF